MGKEAKKKALGDSGALGKERVAKKPKPASSKKSALVKPSPSSVPASSPKAVKETAADAAEAVTKPKDEEKKVKVEDAVAEDEKSEAEETEAVAAKDEDLKALAERSADSWTRQDEPHTLLITNVDVAVLDEPQRLLEFLGLNADDVVNYRFRCVPVIPTFHDNVAAGVRKKAFVNKVPCHMYVVCKTEEALQRGLKKSCSLYEGRHIMISVAVAYEQKIPFSVRHTVFVGRLPAAWGEDHLFELFSQVSPVSNVRVIRDAWKHQSQKFGYVEFKSKAAVGLAIKNLNGSSLKPGHELLVEKCLKATKLKGTHSRETLRQKNEVARKVLERRSHTMKLMKSTDQVIRPSRRNGLKKVLKSLDSGNAPAPLAPRSAKGSRNFDASANGDRRFKSQKPRRTDSRSASKRYAPATGKLARTKGTFSKTPDATKGIKKASRVKE